MPRPKLGSIYANVFDLSPKIFGCCFNGIELVFEIVHAQHCSQGHAMDIPRWGGIG